MLPANKVGRKFNKPELTNSKIDTTYALGYQIFRKIVMICRKYRVKSRVLPGSFHSVQGKVLHEMFFYFVFTRNAAIHTWLSKS